MNMDFMEWRSGEGGIKFLYKTNILGPMFWSCDMQQAGNSLTLC